MAFDKRHILERISAAYQNRGKYETRTTVSGSGDDLGFGSGGGQTLRLVNRDGSFNVKRKGLSYLEQFDLYRWLVRISGWKFFLLMLGAYLGLNLVFSGGYLLIGVKGLGGMQSELMLSPFWEAFFFSTQTFTSVGYGRVSPISFGVNLLASFEAFIGLAYLALVTGLLFGRFSAPKVGLIFSKQAVIAPFREETALMFRVANRFNSHISDLEVIVSFAMVQTGPDGKQSRKFHPLELERNRISFFPMNWTVVHPITPDSILFGLTAEDLEESRAEIFIQFRAVDETFLQNVYVRVSYTYEEIKWGHKFQPIIYYAESGHTVVELDRLSESYAVELPVLETV
jgi:inward rectifier potassium channel